MESNSTIYTTSLYGNSSGLTKEELIAKETETIETAVDQVGILKMSNSLPRVPSNQAVAKDQ